MKLFLASRSPRRQQLLQQIAVEFDTIDVKIDERYQAPEPPAHYVQRMACEKAEDAKRRLGADAVVLAADTSVVLDGEVLGKAEQRSDVIEMLNRLSGRRHEVMSAVHIIGDESQTALSVSAVCFKPLNKEEIQYYASLTEPLGKAGAYAIQGHSARFIERISGSYSGIMGLPLFETAELLKRF